MVQYFFFNASQWVLAKEQLSFHKGDRWSKLTLGRFFCRSLLQRQNTFDFFSDSASSPGTENVGNINNKGTSQRTFCFSDLLIPIIAKHVKGVTGKQIRRTPLFFFFLHHICFFSTSPCMYVTSMLTVSAVIGCFTLRNFTWAETQRFSPLWWGRGKKGDQVNRDKVAGVAPTQQLLYSSHKYVVPWSVQWK